MSTVLHINRQDLKLVKKIGVGGFGTVYHMKWKKTSGDVDVAVKKLNEVDKHELEVLSSLSHPNIVKLIGVVSEEIDFMLILELCEGGSLGSYLRKHKDTKPLSHPLFRDWSKQAAKAIEYLQEMKIVHKDIKSENYLITQENVLKLADFGLAKKTGVTVSKATERGTAAYMAPELFIESSLSPTFDIFAYGVVLWELVTMEIPFEGKEYHFIVYHVCNEDMRLPIPEDCPRHLADLMRRCWMKDRRKRPTIKEILSVLSKNEEALPITGATSMSYLTLNQAQAERSTGTHIYTALLQPDTHIYQHLGRITSTHMTMTCDGPNTGRPKAAIPEVEPVKQDREQDMSRYVAPDALLLMKADGAPASEKDNLLREMKLMKLLETHPNVVGLIGCCIDKDPYYIIVEHMANGNLKDFLMKSRKVYDYAKSERDVKSSLTPSQLILFAKQIASGMDFIALHQCIHRDLAARNILVGQDLVCKISDFGLSRDIMNVRTYERQSDAPLPIRWMALESLIDGIFSTESDVWSFGILLWEIITLGAKPYPGMGSKAIIRDLRRGYRMPRPNHCQEKVYNIMIACWASDPSARPTFLQLGQKLDHVLDMEGDYLILDDIAEDIYDDAALPEDDEKV